MLNPFLLTQLKAVFQNAESSKLYQLLESIISYRFFFISKNLSKFVKKKKKKLSKIIIIKVIYNSILSIFIYS